MPGRDVEELAAARDRRGDLRRRRRQGRDAEPVAAGGRIWLPHPPLQGLLLDRGGALPLALFLLSEPFARPDPGYDERDLPALGAGARHHADHAGQLVPYLLADEADDRPPGL